MQEFILLGVIAVSASFEALLMNLKRGHAGIDGWELYVCVRAAEKGSDVGSYYEITQAKHLCSTIKSDIAVRQMVYCGRFKQCATCDLGMITWLLLHAFR